VAGALAAHDGHRRAGHVDHSPEIRLDLSAKVRFVDQFHRGEVAIAGIVDQDVESSEPHGRCCDRSFGFVAIGDVQA
jgi:hypothetical protein